MNRPHYPTLFCKATLANDWDILEQIHINTTQFPLKITWETIPALRYCHLQLPGTPFNLEQTIANTREQTRSFLKLHPEKHPFGPFLPASQCMVYTNTSTIHSNYTNNFRESATTTPLIEYLKGKYTWTTEATDLIQWSWFRQAVSSYKSAAGNHLTKLMFNQLATKTRKATAGGQQWLNPMCPHSITFSDATTKMLSRSGSNSLKTSHTTAIDTMLQTPLDRSF